ASHRRGRPADGFEAGPDPRLGAALQRGRAGALADAAALLLGRGHRTAAVAAASGGDGEGDRTGGGAVEPRAGRADRAGAGAASAAGGGGAPPGGDDDDGGDRRAVP